MIKFTPGPWQLGVVTDWHSEEKHFAVGTGRTDEFGFLEFLMSEPGAEPDENWTSAHESEIFGNMFLASVAPEMFAALKYACKNCLAVNHKDCEKCEVKMILQKIETAKPEGR